MTWKRIVKQRNTDTSKPIGFGSKLDEIRACQVLSRRPRCRRQKARVKAVAQRWHPKNAATKCLHHVERRRAIGADALNLLKTAQMIEAPAPRDTCAQW